MEKEKIIEMINNLIGLSQKNSCTLSEIPEEIQEEYKQFLVEGGHTISQLPNGDNETYDMKEFVKLFVSNHLPEYFGFPKTKC